MELSEYLGLRLEEAEALLKARGKEYCVKTIAPFYKGKAKPVEEGDFRIVKVEEDGEALKLTVCSIPNE